MKATAVANANLALVKYWGKRDEELHLPVHSSISVTLDGLVTTTTVEFSRDFDSDSLNLNGVQVLEDSDSYRIYLIHFLDIVREVAGIDLKAKVVSSNNFPTGAGLASSASGFAAFAMAVNVALNMNLDEKGLSQLARRGSGSATRSIRGGFNEWQAGSKADGSDSFNVHIADAASWSDFCVVACVTSEAQKNINSRVGMTNTVNTSEVYHDSWLAHIGDDLSAMRAAILKKDFSALGKIAEKNALRMHATMMTSSPPILYFNDTTRAIIDTIVAARESGLESYCTMDAGPQVKVLCLSHDVARVQALVGALPGVQEMRVCGVAAEDARVIDQHLF